MPASIVTEQLPDGTVISLEDAVQAMVAASDNTATDLVINIIGHDAIVGLAQELGLRDLLIPASVKHLYAHANDPDVAAFTTSARGLRTFYDAVFRDELFACPATQRRLLAFLRGEDERQGMSWPHGVTCYRKSGSLDTESLFARAIAGAFTKDDAVATWAFVVNQRPAPPPNTVEAMSDVTSSALGAALKGIVGTFTHISPSER